MPAVSVTMEVRRFPISMPRPITLFVEARYYLSSQTKFLSSHNVTRLQYTLFEGGLRCAQLVEFNAIRHILSSYLCLTNCRVTAFVSGGVLPAAMRGVNISAPVHVCDWYAVCFILNSAFACRECQPHCSTADV